MSKALERLLLEDAKWLAVPSLEEEKGMALFQTKFAANTDDTCAISVTAYGLFELYMNGKRVGVQTSDGVVYDELKPGLMHYNKRAMYRTYDLTPYLVEGENTLVAAVAGGWYVWYHPVNVLNFRFRAALQVGEQYIATTPQNWKCAVGGPILDAQIYHGEIVDARISSYEEISAGAGQLNWRAPAVDESIQVEISPMIGLNGIIRKDLERAVVRAWVYSEIVDNGTDFGEALCTPVQLPYTLKANETMVLDMGQNMAGWPYTTLRGNAGTTVHFGFAEMCNDSGSKDRNNDGPKDTIYRANYRGARSEAFYTLRGGEESYRPLFTFFGFQFVELKTDADVEIVDMTGEVVCSLETVSGRIETSSKEVNQLFSNIQWGQWDNYLGVPTDCPQRDERMGWTGDAQVFCRTAAYNSDVSTFMRKFFQDMRDSQGDEGQVPNTWPNIRPKYGSAGWADAAVIMPYTMYLMYGDKEVVRENYDSMERFMGWLGTRDFQGANPEFGDWVAPVPTDKIFIGACYYAGDAKMMAELSQALSEEAGDFYAQRAEYYRELFEQAKKVFAERYLDETGYLKDEAELRTQTAHLLVLHFDLMPETARQRYVDALKTIITEQGFKLSTGFIGTYILLPTLSKVGLDDLAYALFTQPADPSWIHCVLQGATTIWERWNGYSYAKGFYDPGMNSFNHYAYGAVGEWMYRFMIGIEADEKAPGFTHFFLQPRPDTRTDAQVAISGERITWAKGSYDSVAGTIESGWKVEDGAFCYEAVVPQGTTATLMLPAFGEGTVTACANAPAANVDGSYTLAPGAYSFCVK